MSELVVKRQVQKTVTSDWKFSISVSDDKATASGSYVDDFTGWQSRVPILGSAHDSINGMSLIAIDATRLDGGLIKVDLKYESIGAANYPGRPPQTPVGIRRYSLQLSAGEEHILTHRRYKNLEEKEIKALFAISNGAEAADYEGKIESGAGKECLGKINKGILARKDARVIWVERFKTRNLSDISFSNFNRQQNPPRVGGSAKNWLYLGASAQELDEGEIYEIEKSWEYSPDGWDDDLYS